MFFSSAFVPNAVLPDRTNRDVRVAAERPLFHVPVADSEVDEDVVQAPQVRAALLRRAHVGLADDLDQGDASTG